MKRILYLVMAAMMVLAVSCKKEDFLSSMIVGDWTLTEISVYTGDGVLDERSYPEYVYRFTKDHHYSRIEAASNPGTWELNGETLTLNTVNIGGIKESGRVFIAYMEDGKIFMEFTLHPAFDGSYEIRRYER
ncbi:MAG: hypothetical protein J5702_06240 [Bacteroidales bacterium]|nr:hypothetical protein [Bacteroidales bacterium]